MARSEPIYRSAVSLGLALLRLLRVKRSETGLENLPATGGAVLAVTHFGYLEFVLIEWVMWLHNRRRIRFLATKAAFGNPVLGFFMRGMRHIPVDKDAGAEAYSEAVAALRDGELIGVFPEAGVSASFAVRELKTGATRLAAEAGVPVIPVAIWGGQRLATKNRKIGFRDRFDVPVSFSIGSPITVSPDANVIDTTDRLRIAMQRLLDPLQREYPTDGSGEWWQPRSLGGTAPTPVQAAARDAERERQRRKSAALRAEGPAGAL
ncbi:lysophospholipid acyltransferase family protein [Glaciihabitans sp. UYNi722]|uniref:lysophospholipid acyltransferase family protein n=1 Tax=Glaciihabitans sp. UYNi722 TaxID=3156344 RepID=UPI003396E2F4